MRSSALRSKAAQECGLTLVEIMVVLIIIGVVLTTLGTKVLSQGNRAKAKAAQLQLTKIKGHVEQFQLQYNTLPGSLDDLIRCTERTGASCIPLADKEDLVDPWGNVFVYSSQGNAYIVKSLGADGREGGEGVDGELKVEGP